MSRQSELPSKTLSFSAGLFYFIVDKIKEANASQEGINDIQWKDFMFNVSTNIVDGEQSQGTSTIRMSLNPDSRIEGRRYRNPSNTYSFTYPDIYLNDALDAHGYNEEFEFSLHVKFKEKMEELLANSPFKMKEVKVTEDEIRYYISPENKSGTLDTSGIIHYTLESNYDEYTYSYLETDEDKASNYGKNRSHLFSIKLPTINKPDSVLEGSLDDMVGYEVVFKRDPIREEDKIDSPTLPNEGLNIGSNEALSEITEVYASL